MAGQITGPIPIAIVPNFRPAPPTPLPDGSVRSFKCPIPNQATPVIPVPVQVGAGGPDVTIIAPPAGALINATAPNAQTEVLAGSNTYTVTPANVAVSAPSVQAGLASTGVSGSVDLIGYSLPTHDPFLLSFCIPVNPNEALPDIYVNDGITSRLAQKAVVTWAPNGNPDVIEVIAPVDADAGLVTFSTTPGTNPSATIPSTDISQLRLRIRPANHDDMLANPTENFIRTHKNGKYLRSREYFSRFRSVGENLLGIHTIVTYRSDTPSVVFIDFHIENGMMDPAGTGDSQQYNSSNPKIDGEVFFDSIGLEGFSGGIAGWQWVADTPRHSMSGNFLVAPFPNTLHNHYIPPRGNFMRRIALYDPNVSGALQAAQDILARKDKGFATGPNSYFEMGGYGPMKVKCHTPTDDYYYGALTGWDAARAKWSDELATLKADLQNGTANATYLNVAPPVGSWSHPAYLPDGSTGGGVLVGPDMGWFATIEQTRACEVYMHCMAERNTAAMYHYSTGAPVTTYDIAAANVVHPGGTHTAFDMHHTDGGPRQLDHDWWMHPTKSQASPQFTLLPVDPAGGAWRRVQQSPIHTAPHEDALSWMISPTHFGHIDNGHAARSSGFAIPVVWYFNDVLAKRYMEMEGNFREHSITPLKISKWKYDQQGAHESSLAEYIIEATSAPNQATHWERTYAWPFYIQSALWAIKDPAWRAIHQKTMDDAVTALMLTASSVTKVTYRRNRATTSIPYDNFGPPNVAQRTNSLPDGIEETENYDNAQTYMECFVVLMAYAMQKSVYEGVNASKMSDLDDMCITLVQNMVDATPDELGIPFQEFLVVGPSGGSPSSDLSWTFDPVNHANGRKYGGFSEAAIFALAQRSGSTAPLERAMTMMGGVTIEEAIAGAYATDADPGLAVGSETLKYVGPVIAEWQNPSLGFAQVIDSGPAGVSVSAPAVVQPEISFIGNSTSVEETVGTILIPLQLSAELDSTATITVDVNVGLTTADGSDYTVVGFQANQVQFNPGEVSKSMIVDISPDATPEGDEFVVFDITAAEGCKIGSNSRYTVTILGQTADGNRVTDGLICKYDFNEGTGTQIFDRAPAILNDASSPMDLFIQNPANFTWNPTQGLTCTTLGGRVWTNAPATKIYDALTTTEAFTIEMWYQCTAANPGTPGRILSLAATSSGTSNHNLMVGITSNFAVETRARTELTDNNGTPSVLTTNGATQQNALHHIVWTRFAESQGPDGTPPSGDNDYNHKIYVDGAEQDIGTWLVEGSFTGGTPAWNPGYWLSLFMDVSGGGNPGTLGTYYLLAIYNRGLSETEVLQNFGAGLDGGGTIPPPAVSFNAAASSFDEDAGTVDVLVQLSRPVLGGEGTLQVSFAQTGGNATSPGNYSFVTASPLTFRGGDQEQNIQLSLVDIPTNQGDKTIQLTLTPGAGVNSGANMVHTLTIVDLQEPVIAQFTNPSSSIIEAGGTRTLQVELDHTYGGDSSITFNGTGSTATQGVDWSFVTSSPLVIPEGSTTGDIEIDVNGGTAGEQIVVNLTGVDTGFIGTNSTHTVTIAADTGIPSASNTGLTGSLTATNSTGAYTLSGNTILNTDFTNGCTVTGQNNTFINCRFDGKEYDVNLGGRNYALDVQGSGNEFINCETVKGENCIYNRPGSGASNANRTRFINCKFGDSGEDGGKLIRYAYFEFCYWYGLGKKAGSHADGTQSNHYGDTTFFRCHFDMPRPESPRYPNDGSKSNACGLWNPKQVAPNSYTNLLYEECWINGGDQPLQFRDADGDVTTTDNVRVINCRFGIDYAGGSLIADRAGNNHGNGDITESGSTWFLPDGYVPSPGYPSDGDPIAWELGVWLDEGIPNGTLWGVGLPPGPWPASL